MMRPLNSYTLSPILCQAINQIVEGEGIKLDTIARGVSRLSQMFTKERHTLSHLYFERHELATAYVQYFLPVNLAKVGILLEEIPVVDMTSRLSVLDVGAGPGTAGLAVLDWVHRTNFSGEVQVTAVDTSPMALRYGKRLWQRVCHAEGGAKANLELIEGSIERAACVEKIRENGLYDLIILANSLNEISGDSHDPLGARTTLLTGLLDVLSPHGSMIIVEPALRETSRDLYHVRDRLLQDGRCTVYSPCLHEHECPALVKPHDWCHEERLWDPPAAIRAIDAQVGFIKDALKFSYLILRKDGKTIIDRRPDRYRVVSELRVMKGEKRAWLCNELGRQEVGRQDRLVTDCNASFDEWHRGDIVQIEKVSYKERHGKVSTLGRIEPDVAVQIIRSV